MGWFAHLCRAYTCAKWRRWIWCTSQRTVKRWMSDTRLTVFDSRMFWMFQFLQHVMCPATCYVSCNILCVLQHVTCLASCCVLALQLMFFRFCDIGFLFCQMSFLAKCELYCSLLAHGMFPTRHNVPVKMETNVIYGNWTNLLFEDLTIKKISALCAEIDCWLVINLEPRRHWLRMVSRCYVFGLTRSRGQHLWQLLWRLLL